MWYEMLVPMGIMVLTTSLPALITPYWNRFYLGNTYNRYTEDEITEVFWHRDRHLSGNPYRPNGIDTLPDEPPKAK